MNNSELHINNDLFRLVATGDERAFQVLFNEYWPKVYGTSLRLTHSPEQARDLSQDIFIKLWEQRARLEGVQNPESYIYILSRNLVMDYLRKRVFAPVNIDFLVTYFSGDTVTPQEKLEFRELEVGLNAAIDTMPEKVREVFRLSRYEGLTHEQIADRLGISEGSSKTYIVRALQHIRKEMENSWGDLTILLAALLLHR